jgi:hypothetical protein
VALRQNLATNPALKTDATGWSAVSNTGTVLADWGRSTSVDAALPRTTGFEGTTGGDVLTPRVPVVPPASLTTGRSASRRWRATCPRTCWSTSTPAPCPGSAFVANSGPTVPLNLAAGATNRFVVGPYTVPATGGGRLFEAERLGWWRGGHRLPGGVGRPRSARTSTGTRRARRGTARTGCRRRRSGNWSESLSARGRVCSGGVGGWAGDVGAGVVGRSRGRSRRAGSSASRCGCGTGS